MTCYYVYKHLDASGNTVYIGSGKGDRAWSRKNRKTNHKEHMNTMYNSGELDWVVIISKKHTEAEARDIERDLILSETPKHNIRVSTLSTPQRDAIVSRLATTRSKDLMEEFKVSSGCIASLRNKYSIPSPKAYRYSKK